MIETDGIGKTITEPKQTVAIVTDSVAQVPAEIAQELDISVVPLTVQIAGQQFLDGIDLSPIELYRRMRLEKVIPTTTAPSLGQYLETFRTRLCDGAQAVLYVSLSSKLSSSYRIACLAADQMLTDYPEQTIEVLDNRQAAIAQGFVAIAAARLAVEGKPLSEVMKAAREASHHTGLVVTLETLEYLALGGLIGKVAYMLGSLIDIKPILTIDEQGAATPVSRMRGENHALHAIVDYVARQVEGCRRLYLAIMEADALEQAARLQELVLQKLQPLEVFHSEFTPVMGVHTGPGLVGLGYYYDFG
jgi:DegV family protein with EDD domain